MCHKTGDVPLYLPLNNQFFRREWRERRCGAPHLAWYQPTCEGKVFRWGGASGEATLWVSLFEKGAHTQTLHGWLTVCPWQLVICQHWAAFSGGNVINFTLPSSEISPINHPRLSLCAGLCCRPGWQIFTWFLCPQAPRGYRRRERVSKRLLGWHIHLMTGVENNKKMRKMTCTCHQQILTPLLSISFSRCSLLSCLDKWREKKKAQMGWNNPGMTRTCWATRFPWSRFFQT